MRWRSTVIYLLERLTTRDVYQFGMKYGVQVPYKKNSLHKFKQS